MVSIPYTDIVEDFFASSRKNRVSDVLCKILSRESLEASDIVNIQQIKQAVRNVVTYMAGKEDKNRRGKDSFCEKYADWIRKGRLNFCVVIERKEDSFESGVGPGPGRPHCRSPETKFRQLQ